MKTLNKINKAVDIFTTVFAYIAGAALIFNVVIILANVILRYFGKAVVGVEEYVALSEILVIFLAIGYTQSKRGLVHVCFFMKKIPGKGALIVWALNMWIAVAVLACLAYETFKRAPAVRQVSTALLLPYKPFYYVIAVGAVVWMIAQLFDAVKSTVAIFNREVALDVIEHWPA